MSLAPVLVWVVAFGFVLASLFYFALLWTRKRARADALCEVRRQFEGITILALAPDACFKGLDRIWDRQWRGRGVLILTKELLYFRSWQRKIDMTIPLSRMQKVELGPGAEKESRRKKLFQVSYSGIDGLPRAAIWYVDEPKQWIDLIEAML